MDPEDDTLHLWMEPQILKDWVMDLKAREFLISRIDTFLAGIKVCLRNRSNAIVSISCHLTCFYQLQNI
jgi:hypothetical protein